jgi:Secretion system C-terminal sorting domain
MKNIQIGLLTLCLLIFTSKANSQMNDKWADSAAVWHSTYNWIGMKGSMKTVYTSDTTINSKLCQKLVITNEMLLPTGPGTFVLIQNFSTIPPLYFYKSNDSVFVYRNNIFNLAFKTNASIGEIWNLGRSSYFQYPINEYVKVDSIFYSIYNGDTLRNIHVHPCDSLGNTVGFNMLATDTLLISKLDIINEKFGPLFGFTAIGGGAINNMIDETLQQKLLCYESAVFPFYQMDTTIDCRNNISTNIENSSENELFLIYPNPANNIIQVDKSGKMDDGSILIVYNIFGREQLQQNLMESSNKVEIDNLAAGIYFYKVMNGNQDLKMGKLIVTR